MRNRARDPRWTGDPADLDEQADLLDADTWQPIRRRARRTEPAARGRLTEQTRARLDREAADGDRTMPVAEPAGPPLGDRWSTWAGADVRGPMPPPDWVITVDEAVDIERGVVKTGKEADVFLVERSVPGGASTLLATKRYRGTAHRLFHRDAGYLEGRRMKESREQRAVERRTGFGRNLIAQQWAAAEFDALAALWQADLPVPYPVQRIGTELMVEFIGTSDGVAAPRLSDIRAEPAELLDLWQQLMEALVGMAGMGYTHGDLSAYNILVDDDTLVLIDLPQLVDVVTNPQGVDYLARDVRSVTGWFAGRGLPADVADPEVVIGTLLAEITMR